MFAVCVINRFVHFVLLCRVTPKSASMNWSCRTFPEKKWRTQLERARSDWSCSRRSCCSSNRICRRRKELARSSKWKKRSWWKKWPVQTSMLSSYFEVAAWLFIMTGMQSTKYVINYFRGLICQKWLRFLFKSCCSIIVELWWKKWPVQTSMLVNYLWWSDGRNDRSQIKYVGQLFMWVFYG